MSKVIVNILQQNNKNVEKQFSHYPYFSLWW